MIFNSGLKSSEKLYPEFYLLGIQRDHKPFAVYGYERGEISINKYSSNTNFKSSFNITLEIKCMMVCH